MSSCVREGEMLNRMKCQFLPIEPGVTIAMHHNLHHQGRLWTPNARKPWRVGALAAYIALISVAVEE
jgi:hypothetical protein